MLLVGQAVAEYHSLFIDCAAANLQCCFPCRTYLESQAGGLRDRRLRTPIAARLTAVVPEALNKAFASLEGEQKICAMRRPIGIFAVGSEEHEPHHRAKP